MINNTEEDSSKAGKTDFIMIPGNIRSIVVQKKSPLTPENLIAIVPQANLVSTQVLFYLLRLV